MIHATSVMCEPGETVYEATARIQVTRQRRAELRAPVDKLAERDRLTRFWKAAYPQWQPDLCRIAPNFALVHVDSFRRGMLHGHLSLLPGHVPPHLSHRFKSPVKTTSAPAAGQSQLPLWPAVA